MSNFLNETSDFGLDVSCNNEDIADACRLLGLSGPLEALLRGLRLEQLSRPRRVERGNY